MMLNLNAIEESVWILHWNSLIPWHMIPETLEISQKLCACSCRHICRKVNANKYEESEWNGPWNLSLTNMYWVLLEFYASSSVLENCFASPPTPPTNGKLSLYQWNWLPLLRNVLNCFIHPARLKPFKCCCLVVCLFFFDCFSLCFSFCVVESVRVWMAWR